MCKTRVLCHMNLIVFVPIVVSRVTCALSYTPPAEYVNSVCLTLHPPTLAMQRSTRRHVRQFICLAHVW